jgi:hypothetical protein
MLTFVVGMLNQCYARNKQKTLMGHCNVDLTVHLVFLTLVESNQVNLLGDNLLV